METTEQVAIKEKMVAEAFALFCRNGIKSVSMDDIARHLCMSKKTIYKWFNTKDEVVYSALYTYLKSIEEECEAILSQSDNAIDALLNMMGLVRKIFSGLHPSIFHDLQKYHPDSWKLWQRYKNQFMLDLITRHLQRGIDEGLFRKDLDVEVMARLRLAQIELPFDGRIFPPHEFELKRVQLVSLEHFMLGIATLKGHKRINDYKHITDNE